MALSDLNSFKTKSTQRCELLFENGIEMANLEGGEVM